MGERLIIIDEWVVVLRGPRGKKGGPMSVEIQNAAFKDRAMARALAQVVSVWVNATRGVTR